MAAESIHPSRLTADQAARLLSAAAGVRIAADQIVADIAAGAPTNADGTLNMIHYTAWLARESKSG